MSEEGLGPSTSGESFLHTVHMLPLQNDAQSDYRAPPVAGQRAAPTKTSSEAAFTVKGRPVRAWLTSLGINLVPCSAPWWSPWASLYHPPECIPFEEILSACARERGCSLPCRAKQQASHACSLVALLAVQRCCCADFRCVTRRMILLLACLQGAVPLSCSIQVMDAIPVGLSACSLSLFHSFVASMCMQP